MLFSSIPFLYGFLPITLICYLITPRKAKYVTLCLASMVFYAWGEPIYLLFLILSIAIAYVFSLLITFFCDAEETEALSHDGKLLREKKCSLDRILCCFFFVLSILLPLGALFYFKYCDFCIQNLNFIFHSSIPFRNPPLPLGISFFTFQIISYQIDLYRGNIRPQKNPLKLAAYITMFPQLVAGPIVRYRDISEQFDSFSFDIIRIGNGLRRFFIGLSKKVLLANQLSEICSAYRSTTAPSILFGWLYAIAFTLQIYFDFSGYSDMAIGLGNILGFSFPENFQYPYQSKSITEFWRRWHISLGSWFRDYVYIPLGGNRVGRIRFYFNIIFVWFLTGFWHGASWNFILWGFLFAILLLIEKNFCLSYLMKSKILGHAYTLFFVILGFVLFNATNLMQFWNDLKAMFSLKEYPLYTLETLYHTKRFAILLCLSILGTTAFPRKWYQKIQETQKGSRILTILEPITLLLLLFLVTAFIVDASFQPFLYFRF